MDYGIDQDIHDTLQRATAEINTAVARAEATGFAVALTFSPLRRPGLAVLRAEIVGGGQLDIENAGPFPMPPL